MRLYDDVRDSVVCLGFRKDGDDFIPVGSGFLVAHGPVIYLVTAAHVAKVLGDGGFVVRLNDNDEKARLVDVDQAKWWMHPSDDKVDIAVLSLELPEWAKVSPWISKWFITEFKRETKGIGAGDLAHVVGLFHYHPGTRMNTPFVHTGHIAMMADGELVGIQDWRAADPKTAPPIEVEGYLIEAQTLKGLSGAPVFVRRSLATKVSIPHLDTNPLKVWWHGSLWLLGLWHGAWFVPPDPERELPRGITVPVGMGVAVPAKKILEVLDQEELLEIRKSISS